MQFIRKTTTPVIFLFRFACALFFYTGKLCLSSRRVKIFTKLPPVIKKIWKKQDPGNAAGEKALKPRESCSRTFPASDGDRDTWLKRRLKIAKLSEIYKHRFCKMHKEICGKFNFLERKMHLKLPQLFHSFQVNFTLMEF